MQRIMNSNKAWLIKSLKTVITLNATSSQSVLSNLQAAFKKHKQKTTYFYDQIMLLKCLYDNLSSLWNVYICFFFV